MSGPSQEARPPEGAGPRRRAPSIAVPSALVVASLFGLQGGGAVATLLFDLVTVPAVVTLRLSFAALILLVASRPSIRLWRAQWKLYLSAGLVVCVHHLSFYEAISRIPLGTATTIEFIGPFVLTLRFSHAWHHRAWGCLAFAGVVVLCRPSPTTDWVAIASAAAAAASWATYIVFARSLTRQPRGQSLALTLTVAAAASFVLGGFTVVPQLADTRVIGLGVCVALLSSVAPYTLQLRALRDLTPQTFGVLLSLEPAVAALVGLVFLHQHLTWPQWFGVSAVVAASIGATRGRELEKVRADG